MLNEPSYLLRLVNPDALLVIKLAVLSFCLKNWFCLGTTLLVVWQN